MPRRSQSQYSSASLTRAILLGLHCAVNSQYSSASLTGAILYGLPRAVDSQYNSASLTRVILFGLPHAVVLSIASITMPFSQGQYYLHYPVLSISRFCQSHRGNTIWTTPCCIVLPVSQVQYYLDYPMLSSVSIVLPVSRAILSGLPHAVITQYSSASLTGAILFGLPLAVDRASTVLLVSQGQY